MYKTETQIRVRYSETDQMGYVYYGCYAQYIEVARTEALRQLDITYAELEKQGIILPVVILNIKYIKPAFYDELLIIVTTMKELPCFKLKFEYEIYNEKKILINQSYSELVFVNKTIRKPCRAPDHLVEKLKEFFNPNESDN